MLQCTQFLVWQRGICHKLCSSATGYRIPLRQGGSYSSLDCKALCMAGEVHCREGRIENTAKGAARWNSRNVQEEKTVQSQRMPLLVFD